MHSHQGDFPKFGHICVEISESDMATYNINTVMEYHNKLEVYRTISNFSIRIFIATPTKSGDFIIVVNAMVLQTKNSHNHFIIISH